MRINYAPVLGGTETETDDNSNEKMDVALCPTRKISIKMTMVMMMTMKMKMTMTTRVILMTMRVMTMQNEGAQEDVLKSTKGAGATIKDLRTSTGLRLQDDQDHDDDDYDGDIPEIMITRVKEGYKQIGPGPLRPRPDSDSRMTKIMMRMI